MAIEQQIVGVVWFGGFLIIWIVKITWKDRITGWEDIGLVRKINRWEYFLQHGETISLELTK